ncbi:SDR family NAD(P)-dependent oxidoreductase [Ensifer sp. BR816]|uniref:SDR family NAD(P)-dependent oxidoreductase n=1 Tax=Rhizobium sp. (strain BR816) TaxID=1057002 RepID=UPI00037BAC35|nr:SDR family NAD(P)-dependent oxidoreductase [Ensifer sp. BR816]
MFDNNPLALVTGAGRGIGAAISRSLAQAGARVLVIDLDGTKAHEVARSLQADGFNAHHDVLDVTDRAAIEALAARLPAWLGHVAILVNNAGIGGNERMDDPTSAAAWDRNIAVNLTGAFDMTRALLPSLKATRGTVINISSVVAFTSGFAHVSYTASKGGVRSLTQIMCRELAPYSIRVNAVAPGYIDTEMGRGGDSSMDEWLGWHCPMGRFGQPDEVAAPVVFLASKAASFINGVTLPVDGGYLTV